MDNASSVSKKALHYRVAIFESIGVIITLAFTAIVAVVLYFLKFKAAVLVDSLTFVILFVLQVITLYFMAFMQYKNLKYSIGQNAISFQRGSFGIERETIPFEKIKNSTFDQSFIQRLFSVGDITIEQESEKYTWENIDSQTATLISNTVSTKGDVQPITVATATAAITPPPPAQT
jgi:membrane protein YdbS with pleckstrin-like domain